MVPEVGFNKVRSKSKRVLFPAPDLTFAATASAVIHAKATPVFCEISDKTWCIDSSAIEKLITKSTKAIIPVHLYGYPADMQKILSIANKHNLLVIEDCAEALGSKIHKRPVGSFAHASTFSFFGNKTISTGEGGMVLFRDKEAANKARTLRDHGMSPAKRYWHEVVVITIDLLIFRLL